MQGSLRLAAVRAAEQQQEFPLFADSFSAPALDALAEAHQATAADSVSASAAAAGAAAAAALPDLSADAAATREALATRFLDEQLLRAVTIVNMERDLTQVGGWVGGGPGLPLPAVLCVKCRITRWRRLAMPQTQTVGWPKNPAVELPPPQATNGWLCCLGLLDSPRRPLSPHPAQEYNQVVLVGDALDTRPFRLPWPEGTVMFCVAPQVGPKSTGWMGGMGGWGGASARRLPPFQAKWFLWKLDWRHPPSVLGRAGLLSDADSPTLSNPDPATQAAHAAADAAFKAQGARVPRGCLLRRVPAELGQLEEGGGGFVSALERAGFRGERLSVWVLQVRAVGGGDGEVGAAGAVLRRVLAQHGAVRCGVPSSPQPTQPINLKPPPCPPATRLLMMARGLTGRSRLTALLE